MRSASSWDERGMHDFDTAKMMRDIREGAKTPGTSVRKDGDAEGALAGAAKQSRRSTSFRTSRT